MSKSIIIVALTIFFFIPIAWATPPASLDLKYDADAGILHVEARHVSDHLDKHYIRKLIIIRNDVKDQEFLYTRQKSPAKFVDDISLKMEENDNITVEVYCSKGGSKRAGLTFVNPQPVDVDF